MEVLEAAFVRAETARGGGEQARRRPRKSENHSARGGEGLRVEVRQWNCSGSSGGMDRRRRRRSNSDNGIWATKG